MEQSLLEKLVSLAYRLDDEGRILDADTIDTAIAKLAEAESAPEKMQLLYGPKLLQMLKIRMSKDPDVGKYMATLNPKAIWMSDDADIDGKIMQSIGALTDVVSGQQQGIEYQEFEDFYQQLRPEIAKIMMQYKPLNERPHRSLPKVV